MEPTLLTSRDDAVTTDGEDRGAGVVTVTIHHPEKRNAMTPGMWRQLPPLLKDLAADPGVRVLVLTGAEGTFCAGADIGSLRGTGATGDPALSAGGAAGESQAMAVAAEEALAGFPKPTLAAVHGHCVGGGCQLAAACDLRFAAEDALFGITPAKLGIVYPASSTERLVRLVGPATAKYLLFSGELIDAERALRTGLVDEVHPADELDQRVASFARTLTRRSALTQAAAKDFTDGHTDPARRAHWQREAAACGEAAEGVAAFLERRPPRFNWPS
ncbi:MULTISPECIES: enoyl-CoA hydratase/isomerase family protein [unclassified Streptomyces]|uniref:enoyl-CoA hydratase/isomerase family protein n=1 Tax=unclassified Streptomyces TaxID=2593676 RepID=UPI002DD8DBEC|nr:MULTISPECIES: enoyl-CoA hydratase/isomerase family protein [unclassified Streptomyces]WSB75420.1 enoyl-CoA hydratase/isomerase family protein [Streptomyces sp. NBC_01775]WSS16297.1 enoyl-CoA hydratase/isomerase family protein [Streptomyces sp. NBC_01186]WSS45115.1 enoyl-CoA hydratase/isomerase family protein [Streptomyces sp. NBC_01187]